MLEIKSVSMRNFLSVGNVTQAVRLDKEGLCLVLGENLDTGGANSRNGVGKSTLIQAISFGLFGLPISNIKRDNLVNSYNSKNMVVSVEFEKDGRTYKIERGRKPTFIRFYVNDGLVNAPDTDESQGDSRNTQDEIDTIVGMSHEMFKHIVAMNTYTDPFLKMKPGDQRVLIEELLGITQISHRSEVLKEIVKTTKDSIREEEFRIKAVLESNTKIQSSINDLQLKRSSWEVQRQRRIDAAKGALSILTKINIDEEVAAHRTLADFKALATELNRSRTEFRRSEQKLIEKNEALDRAVLQLASISEHKCHTCGQDVHDASHERLLSELTTKVSKLESELDSIASEYSEQQALVEELQAAMTSIGEEPVTSYSSLDEALEHRNTLNNLLDELKREEESVNPYSDQIQILSESGIQEVAYDDLNEMQSLLKHQDFLLKLLTSKDSFIRKKIIDQNISHLNHRLNFYLEKLGLPHEVRFMSDLSTEISLLGRDFDFEQLSRGEMNRVILSTSWAFRDVWESLNQSVNLMMVDEMLDSGIDSQGSEQALDLLKKMARERGKNIFLISHKEELIGRVNKILLVKKENSFTRFEEEITDESGQSGPEAGD